MYSYRHIGNYYWSSLLVILQQSQMIVQEGHALVLEYLKTSSLKLIHL